MRKKWKNKNEKEEKKSYEGKWGKEKHSRLSHLFSYVLQLPWTFLMLVLTTQIYEFWVFIIAIIFEKYYSAKYLPPFFFI